MAEIDDTFFAPTVEDWSRWLQAHGEAADHIWLLIHKKGVGEPSVTYDEAVEEALCWGWIDGHTKAWDERSYAVRFSPRKPGSVWAESNVNRVERMIAQGRMQPRGMALVEEAKRRGTWQAARTPLTDVAPPDLQAALDADGVALERWTTWGPSHRRQYIFWVNEAKRAETRERRIAEVVRRAAAALRPGEPG